MRIGLDMMGGDYAPQEAVKGISLYLSEQGAASHLVLLGDEEQVRPLLKEHGLDHHDFTIVHAPQVIDMHEHPTKALKEKQYKFIDLGILIILIKVLN